MNTATNNNWIPVESGTLPEQHTVEPNLTMSDEVSVTFINMDGEYETGTDKLINDTWAYYGNRVVAWCKKPEAYNPNKTVNEWISITDVLPPTNVLVKVLLTNDIEMIDFVHEPFDAETPFQHYLVKAWRMLTTEELREFLSKSNKKTVTKSISHLDFLLDCTDATDTSVKVEDDKKIVRATFCGSEDCSWTEYEYVFDLNGNYISHKEIDHH